MFNNEYLNKCIEEEKGNGYLARGYQYTLNKKCEKLVINDLGFCYDRKGLESLKEMKEELIKADIKEFIVTETSSGLMKILHAMDSLEMKLQGVEIIQCWDKYDEIWEDVQGLKIVIE